MDSNIWVISAKWLNPGSQIRGFCGSETKVTERKTLKQQVFSQFMVLEDSVHGPVALWFWAPAEAEYHGGNLWCTLSITENKEREATGPRYLEGSSPSKYFLTKLHLSNVL